MSKKFLIALLTIWLGVVLTPSLAHAQDAEWRVTSRSGVVRLREPGRAPRDAGLNDSLRPGTTVTTGAASAATIENGAQRMTMSANSRMTIARSSSPGMTGILQNLGSILFQVDRRRVQHFRVETPRLAAVVKGTTFTVTVNSHFERVDVAQGLVEVRANQGGAMREVASGQSVRVADTEPRELVMNASAGASAGDGGSSIRQAGDGDVPQIGESAAQPAPLRGQLDFFSTDDASAAGGAAALHAGAGAQNDGAAQLALERRAQDAQARLGRLSSEDSPAIVRFMALYLGGSFALGFAFFFVARRIAALGRPVKPVKKKPPQEPETQIPRWLRRRPGGFSKIAGLDTKP
ncbi:MAG: FecR domain-containing protein [Hyphomonadaceae bacterium]